MKRFLAGFTVLLIIAIVVMAVVIHFQPDRFMVERSASIDAPPSKVFPLVNNVKAWDQWSPWAKLDPNAKMTYSGPPEGEGAKFSWAGNENVGEGSMTIVESKVPEKIVFDQVFVKPMAGTAQVIFNFTPANGGTKVDWRIEGENDFLGKAMCLFMDMDAMIGTEFEKGLKAIEEIAEGEKSPENPAERDEPKAEEEKPKATEPAKSE